MELFTKPEKKETPERPLDGGIRCPKMADAFFKRYDASRVNVDMGTKTPPGLTPKQRADHFYGGKS